jgi:hypothetical protein
MDRDKLRPLQHETLVDLEVRYLVSLIDNSRPTEESFRLRKEHNEELRQRLANLTEQVKK